MKIAYSVKKPQSADETSVIIDAYQIGQKEIPKRLYIGTEQTEKEMDSGIVRNIVSEAIRQRQNIPDNQSVTDNNHINLSWDDELRIRISNSLGDTPLWEVDKHLDLESGEAAAFFALGYPIDLLLGLKIIDKYELPIGLNIKDANVVVD